ncbi:E3 ubiquitin-protein ligase RNF25 isoform X2 [Telopea speciosissima]|uniref:E3 ubiquitin-protein ligase RNF25 isoform X2 n=1 Tax=Telopea speciosissima TaxID=54955 RepID=UPI001CC3D11C|nr:E3 ubiquitin-protein ligase RNF25 isoform X2 [Telopea speciosissima]
MAEEEEVIFEVEALRAVYDDDCLVIQSFPPHIHVHIRPRTADDSSQQFVEVILGIRAGAEYPKEPPHIDIIESKGLDGKRQAHLFTSIQDKARELSSCLMLVALCEEAVEMLSNMNHPDGDCSLCLYPLVPEDKGTALLPFMKLMSCFHCFHSECITRWWKWLKEQNTTSSNNSSDSTTLPSRDLGRSQDVSGLMENLGKCPVCRKVFYTKDIEHVVDLVESSLSQLDFQGAEADDDGELLHSDVENIRRQKFEAVLKVQQENSGLNEPKKDKVLLPGMFLSLTIAQSMTSTEHPIEQQSKDASCTATMKTNSSGSSNKPKTNSSESSNRPSTSEHKKLGMRRYRAQNPKKQLKQWVKKDTL